MASAVRSLVVEQRFNPKFASDHSDSPSNPELLYYVVKAVNVLKPRIGAYLSAWEVSDLIKDGINVTVQPVK